MQTLFTIRKWLLIGVAVFLVVVASRNIFLAKQNNQAVVELRKGAGVDSLARSLKRNGIISSVTVFKLQSLFYSSGNYLQYGEYEVSSRMSAKQIIKKVIRGDIVYRKVTIPEGLTVKQVKDLLNKNELLTGEISLNPDEGTILPETYSFKKLDSRDSIIKQMQDSMDKAINEVWAKRNPDIDKYIKTPADLINLAAIVEKETMIDVEKPTVAGVYLNRLEKRMCLQADPTVIYGAKGYAGDITYKMLRDEKNEYNTYVHFGLPPTAIANPGIDSLKAVANPEKHDFLYFVADGKGGHVFAKTYKEHHMNVKKYLKAIGYK